MLEIILLIVWVVTLILYFPLNRRKQKYYWEKSWDRWIPLWPSAVWLYVMFYPWLGWGLLVAINNDGLVRLLVALIVTQVGALMFWMIWPNGVKRPEIGGEGWSWKLLSWIYRHDRDGNGFPSLHVAKSLVVAVYLSRFWPELTVVWWVVGGLILVSTVLTKQHYVVDVVGGIFWAGLVCVVVK